jgi:hypothetical protein
MAVSLVTAGPLGGQCPEPEAHQFDFWIGEWDVNNRYVVQGAWRDIGRAEVEVFAAAGGCAIVELWEGGMGAQRIQGFSARTWNPADSTWQLVLNWPQAMQQPTFATLTGRFRHGRGEFFRPPADSEPRLLTRYTFSDIASDRFRWNDDTSRDSGLTWQTRWIMEYSRRPDGARAVRNAAEAKDRTCTGPAFDDAEDLLGRWRDSGSTMLHAYRVIGGCAAMLFLEWTEDDRPQELFVVIGLDSRSNEWTGWAASTRHRGFQRLTGTSVTELSGTGSLAWTAAGAVRTLLWTAPSGQTRRFTIRRP